MIPEADHRELRFLLGPYLLGGLSGADRARLETHLAECRDCERELARLAPVPGLLGRQRDPEMPHREEPASDDLLDRVLDEVRHERRVTRRRRVVVALAAAASVVVALVVGVSVFQEPDRTPAAVVALEPVSGSGTDGSVALTPKPWGTAMTVELRGLPPAGPFRLEVTGGDGVREVAATWGTTPGGSAVVAGATAITADQVEAVRVLGPDGPILEGALAGG